MNRTRILAVGGAAVLLALLAGLGAYRYLSEKGRMADRARLETVGIVVALVDIPLGSTINSNQVAVSAWPKGNYPKDAFADVKPALGRMARREFLRGEPIVESKLVPTDKNSGLLSLKVPTGMRAFSVKVNEVVGVGGFIVPDAHVDVIVTTAVAPQRQQEQVSKLILQDILVLACGQAIEQKDNKPVTVNTVTLAVTTEEAEKLALASNDGKIQLVLRHFADGGRVETAGADKPGLLASYRPPQAPKPASGKPPKTRHVVTRASSPQPVRTAYTVEVIRGGKRTADSFE